MASCTREAIQFRSHGEPCRGDLFRPDAVDDPPVVVLGHGFGGERRWVLPAYARRFAAAGVAALAFDYRGFGDSAGRPRNHVDPRRQLEDWGAAIAHARDRSDVDGDRLALWGTSLSGGHGIETAARDGEVAAVVAQVPFTDGFAVTARLLRQGGLAYARGALSETTRDLGRALLGREPHSVPIVASPDEFGVMNTPGAKAGFEALVPEDDTFRNEVPARVAATIPRYRPIEAAADVTCPTFVVEATGDRIVPPRAVERLVSRLDDVERLRVPVGHFDVYQPPEFDRLVDRQATFLARHLDATGDR